MKRFYNMINIILLISMSILLLHPIVYGLDKSCSLAEELYLKGNYRSAIYEAERIFHSYKRRRIKSEAAYIAGLSYLKINNPSKSKEYFLFIIDNSRDSMLIKEAQIGLTNALNILGAPSSSGKKPFYSVQLGCFKDKRNADRLYWRFKRRKYTVRITRQQDGKVNIYKVKVGKFKSKKDALKFANKLRRKGYATAIVRY